MYMQHPDLFLQHLDDNTCNIRLIEMKHLEYTIETYVYSHCNMCNIPIYFCNISIYFCNIDIKHVQHTYETLETYVCNMLFQRKHLLVASQMEAPRRVEVTGVLACNTKLGGGAQRVGAEAAQARSVRRGRVVGAWRAGGRSAGCAFSPRICLPPQGTSLGLCEPPLGTASSSREARSENLAVLLVGI